MSNLKAINSHICNETFRIALEHYAQNKRYEPGDYLRRLLAHKLQIDAEQWDTEDLIRDPEQSGEAVKALKKKIDQLNQKRTDAVELLDDWIHDLFIDVAPSDEARFATETPAWALDRLSILHLKKHHMLLATRRMDITENQRQDYQARWDVLNRQHSVLSKAVDELLQSLADGQNISYTYKQMKMYNDPDLNPLLRKAHK